MWELYIVALELIFIGRKTSALINLQKLGVNLFVFMCEDLVATTEQQMIRGLIFYSNFFWFLLFFKVMWNTDVIFKQV